MTSQSVHSRPRRSAASATHLAEVDQGGQVARLRYCDQPLPIVRPLPDGLAALQQRAILLGRNKWLNGTVLHYYFFNAGRDGSLAAWTAPDAQHAVVRAAFGGWKALGVGLEFQEVTAVSEAEIRIGFDQSDGSWSYVGRDILQAPVTERTMNFGWDLAADAYGMTTALHEIGHTLGMPHEHQNPFAGIVWNEQKVYDYLGGPPNNWPRETTFNNVLRKLDQNEVTGSHWDPNSIMEYAFPGGLIVTPAGFENGLRPPGDLSQVDKDSILAWYPTLGGAGSLPLLAPFTSVPTVLSPGQQVDYRIEPTATRNYEIGTFGASDAVLGLFESVDGSLRYVAADDDSGDDRNALIKQKLFMGRKYVVRVRCYYAQQSATTAVMYW